MLHAALLYWRVCLYLSLREKVSSCSSVLPSKDRLLLRDFLMKSCSWTMNKTLIDLSIRVVTSLQEPIKSNGTRNPNIIGVSSRMSSPQAIYLLIRTRKGLDSIQVIKKLLEGKSFCFYRSTHWPVRRQAAP